MMSLKNFLVGAAVIKVDIPASSSAASCSLLLITIINITLIITINIMLIKVVFLSYAGFKIAACNCSGWVDTIFTFFYHNILVNTIFTFSSKSS